MNTDMAQVENLRQQRYDMAQVQTCASKSGMAQVENLRQQGKMN